ncbi:MAG: redox-sensing transcriptional repressor Rex [Eubacteriales bacterium]|nr:redox-sensing transcriptional repressor Rex [Eubacteriales bacterium]MCI7571217.1 redox-sensing transcriptional repressor Rex [Clostridiales bacterium]MDD7551070.1 redox-sensing transcriptional repressor Rex [Clostridia bacterium]MDY5754339.1 redox-sensing transcriptional repressor Rex [Eubacteriales bacterium]
MDGEVRRHAISVQAFKRMPYYLEYLKSLLNEGVATVSAPNVAAHFNFSEIQVRKDFASVSSSQGKPKQGFELRNLIKDIEEVLGYNNTDEAVLVGVGSLGRALMAYSGFEVYGLKIVAAFDTDENLVGSEVSGKKIIHASRISDMCRRMNVHIGIITVPALCAQTVCDQLVAGGVKAIWNFAPLHLSVPDNILVQNENMAASLALLSRHLREQMKG